MQVPYISSISSAETLTSSSITLPSCHQTIDPELPACWRRSEVEDAVKAKNWQTISRLRKYRPFTNEFVDAQDLHTILFTPLLPSSLSIPEGESIPTATLEMEDEDTLAEILDERLWADFGTVPFEHWVQKALGLSPDSIMSLEMSFFRFNHRLRRFIFNAPDSAEVREKFRRIAKILKENPFAIVISIACEYTAQWPTVDFTFILNPLQEVLSQQEPLSRIMQQLDILAARFHRHYSDRFLDRQRAFDIDTPLLTLLDRPIMSAVSRTRGDLKEFRKLEGIDFSAFAHDQDMIPLGENTLVKQLGARWNSLCEAVEECAVVPELCGRLVQYAKALNRLRNFYSLSAVMHGLVLAQVHTRELRRLSYLVDGNANYQRYRQRIDETPVLHFVFPLVTAATFGDKNAIKHIFAFRHYQVGQRKRWWW